MLRTFYQLRLWLIGEVLGLMAALWPVDDPHFVEAQLLFLKLFSLLAK